jgi:hypothetical protein
MPAPPAEPAIPRVDEVKVGSCRQDVEVHYRQDEELQTPLTPVSAEAFTSLQNLIIQQDAYALDETSKQNLAKHLQKCTKAFQKSSALSVLQEDRIRFLTTINNEAKVRRSTKSLVLGKAKVMSYEDLVEARAKRVVKDATRAAKGKGKRGRKRKSAALEADEPEPEEPEPEEPEPEEPEPEANLEPEPEPEVARTAKEAIKGRRKRGRKRKIAAQEADEPEPEVARLMYTPVPWRAQIARMI